MCPGIPLYTHVYHTGMGRKEQVQARLPKNHYDRLATFRDDRDLSNSEAVRQLIVAGLDAKGVGRQSDQPDDSEQPDDTEQPDGLVHRMAQMGADRIGYIALVIGAFGIGTMF